ncbi:MAG: hypothetical protein DSM106950_07845 [Stigonema ocellatum SAG 48.90 = DSM 106950]|nr:hypothetical protein [Stigonema ocellatum SAG 48.90 = DSM 106950]
MKRFAPAILAVLVGSMSVLAVAQNADASPYDGDWYRYHHYDRERDYWRDRRWREERRERRWREERYRERRWREEHGYRDRHDWRR